MTPISLELFTHCDCYNYSGLAALTLYLPYTSRVTSARLEDILLCIRDISESMVCACIAAAILNGPHVP